MLPISELNGHLGPPCGLLCATKGLCANRIVCAIQFHPHGRRAFLSPPPNNRHHHHHNHYRHQKFTTHTNATASIIIHHHNIQSINDLIWWNLTYLLLRTCFLANLIYPNPMMLSRERQWIAVKQANCRRRKSAVVCVRGWRWWCWWRWRRRRRRRRMGNAVELMTAAVLNFLNKVIIIKTTTVSSSSSIGCRIVVVVWLLLWSLITCDLQCVHDSM